MDRAAKVKKYRKKMMKKRSRRRQWANGTPDAGLSGAGAALIGIIAAVLIVFLYLALHDKNDESKLTYVTREEFASLMSFMESTLPEQRLKDSDSVVTCGQLKDFVQSVGLSGIIEITGGNDKMERKALMDCYEQILDYLDLEEAVSRETILLLKQDGNICQTKEGDLRFDINAVELEPFHTYTVYRMDQTLLGIRGESEKTLALRHVLIQSVSGKKESDKKASSEKTIDFVYHDQEYQIPCGDYTEELRAGMHCTLCIKGGRVTKIKQIEPTEQSDGNGNTKEKQTVQTLPETVKVLLLNQGNIHYDQVYLVCDGSFGVKRNKKRNTYKKSDVLSVKKLKLKKGSCMVAEPDKDSSRLFLADGDGNIISKGYYGSMIVYRDKEGYYIVNKVNIEKYLYSVVASEMPSSFGLEALKAQAVCARSYVYKQMMAEDYSSYHAQIDDSTNYQVYNKSDVSDLDVQAVEETAGEIMYFQDKIVNAYYFSSSFGYTSSMEIWNQKEEDYPYLKAKSLNLPEETSEPSSGSASGKSSKKGEKFDLSDEDDFRDYITSKKASAYDSSSRYFRWTAKAEPGACLKEIREKITQRRKMNPDNFTCYSTKGKKAKKVNSLKGFGGIKNMYCSKRGKSGAILVLTIVFEFGKVEIKSEYNIRSIVGCALEQITYADGTVDTSSRFLPSAYFFISFHNKSKRYILTGGGNGHGMGMSQYGAASMAEAGWDYEKILKFFYDGVRLEKQDRKN